MPSELVQRRVETRPHSADKARETRSLQGQMRPVAAAPAATKPLLHSKP